MVSLYGLEGLGLGFRVFAFVPYRVYIGDSREYIGFIWGLFGAYTGFI